MNEPEMMPEPYRSIVEAVTASDAEWFARPGKTGRIRSYVPGELGPDGDRDPCPNCGERWMWVRPFGPGVRSRTVVCQCDLDEAYHRPTDEDRAPTTAGLIAADARHWRHHDPAGTLRAYHGRPVELRDHTPEITEDGDVRTSTPATLVMPGDPDEYDLALDLEGEDPQ